MISPDDLSLYKLTDSVDEAVRRDPAVLQGLSQHAVREEQAGAPAEGSRLAPSCSRRINAEFADILSGGEFTVGGPLPEEKDEPELAACRGWSSASIAAAWAGCATDRRPESRASLDPPRRLRIAGSSPPPLDCG